MIAHSTSLSIALFAAAAAAVLPKARSRWRLSRAKHASLTGHARMSRQVARLIPFYDYDEAMFFVTDGAPADIEDRRRAAFARLSGLFAERFARTRAVTSEASEGLSDLQFTAAYRVPFQFSRIARTHLSVGSFMQSSHGVCVTDLDDNVFYDLTGSYGVNVFGNDFYKECIARAEQRARALGPVLGSYHPIVADNIRRLRALASQDEVSFHMSGTEAVMQAVRLARYHTGKPKVVRFCGAYHGWWGDVQPGVGNPMPADQTYTLAEMSERTLRVLQTRRDIACVLVNPLQALHPNAGAPADSALLDSSRAAGFDRAAYSAWLRELRDVCTERNIVLIFDEVFVGFRLARGGAQEYFGVHADMVTYGKTVAGGLPVGVVCGRKDLMRRFRDEHPVDICFARGTFNAHPYVMAAMDEFLTRLDDAEFCAVYNDLDTTWNARAAKLNDRLADAGLPVRVSNLLSIWTVHYVKPSRYNWMLQYYLRAEHLALSWVGTGRLIFSLNYTDADFVAVADRFVAAAQRMSDDGWWWNDGALTNKIIRRRILREIVAERLSWRRKSRRAAA